LRWFLVNVIQPLVPETIPLDPSDIVRLVESSRESHALAAKLFTRLDEIRDHRTQLDNEEQHIRSALISSGHLAPPEDPRVLVQELFAAGKGDFPIVVGILSVLLSRGEATAAQIVSELETAVRDAAKEQVSLPFVVKPSTIHTALFRLAEGEFISRTSPKKGSPYRVTATGRARFKAMVTALREQF
jgi:predicted transcriptional regulator